MSATQQVISIDDISADNAPVIYVAGGLNQFLEAVKAEVTGEVPDLTTRKGRERIASLAAKVSKSKAAVEKPGRDYLRRLKEMPKVVETELREFVVEMDALRDQVRQPLTEWQAAEDARVDRHNDRLAWLRDLPLNLSGATSVHVQGLIDQADAVAIDDDWEEFKAEAASTKDLAIKALRAIFAELQRYEAEQAELARHRAEAEARAQREREEQIAREAGERVRREAESAAQAEREAVIRREADAKAAAERRELELKLQAEQAERAAAQAEANRIASEQRAEQERIAAEQRQAEAVERARLAEIARANVAADEIIRQQNAREADQAHKKTVNRAALEAFVAGGITEECAKQAITLIAMRKIPNISIQY
jgi:DNA repair exonuclease SbcCD ATPase subunit